MVARHQSFYRHGLPDRSGSGFAIRSHARQFGSAEASSFCYGRRSRLTLLSTPPHGDAVTLSFGYSWGYPGRTLTSCSNTLHSRTTAGLQARSWDAATKRKSGFAETLFGRFGWKARGPTPIASAFHYIVVRASVLRVSPETGEVCTFVIWVRVPTEFPAHRAGKRAPIGGRFYSAAAPGLRFSTAKRSFGFLPRAATP